jgi:hypothetical protein
MAKRKAHVMPEGKRAANAARQRAFRERKLKAIDGDGMRLNMIVPVATAFRLKRLAKHYGVTQITALERALADAERRVQKGMSTGEQSAYLDAVA